MTDFLTITVILLGVVVLLGYFNERVTKLTYEISLMLFSTIIGAAILAIVVTAEGTSAATFLSELQSFDLESFLMEGVLCFMLFAGACHMRLF